MVSARLGDIAQWPFAFGIEGAALLGQGRSEREPRSNRRTPKSASSFRDAARQRGLRPSASLGWPAETRRGRRKGENQRVQKRIHCGPNMGHTVPVFNPPAQKMQPII